MRKFQRVHWFVVILALIVGIVVIGCGQESNNPVGPSVDEVLQNDALKVPVADEVEGMATEESSIEGFPVDSRSMRTWNTNKLYIVALTKGWNRKRLYMKSIKITGTGSNGRRETQYGNPGQNYYFYSYWWWKLGKSLTLEMDLVGYGKRSCTVTLRNSWLNRRSSWTTLRYIGGGKCDMYSGYEHIRF